MALRFVDDGYDFRVLVLDDTWVVRIARRPASAEALQAEAAFLPALAAALPVQVPQFEFVGGDVAVYRFVEGTQLVDEEAGVREFLAALHRFDVARLPVPRPEHLLCRDGRLVGVIDWGDARVGDPALDYAWFAERAVRALAGRPRATPARAVLLPPRAVARGARRDLRRAPLPPRDSR